MCLDVVIYTGGVDGLVFITENVCRPWRKQVSPEHVALGLSDLQLGFGVLTIVWRGVVDWPRTAVHCLICSSRFWG